MKKEKIRRQRTKRWTLTSKGKLQPEILFEVRRILSKEERKNQGRIDDEEILATVEFSALDEFKCSEMKVSICSEKGALITQDEWNEIMKFLLQNTVPSWQAAFVLVNKQNLPANLLPAINDFKEDSVKPGYHYYEVPLQKYFAVFWLLGMSSGMSLGIAKNNQSVGMCLGLSIGMCIGLALDASAKAERKKLKTSRGMSDNMIK